MDMKNSIAKAVAYAAYPSLLLATLATIAATVAFGWDLKSVLWGYLSGLLAVLIALERLFPLSPRWGMTRASFLRDLKYLIAAGAAIGAVRAGFGILALRLGEGHRGPLADVPLLIAVPSALLAFDFLQYWLHRWSHRNAFLWRIHVAHHLPDRVYVVMHAVFHPLGALLTAALLQAVLLLLGLSPEAVFAAMLIIDLQTMVSHFNVDIRAGAFNYLLVGAELHRYHHSADVSEAGNYGAVTPLWDILFGTFRYRPGRPPAALGVEPGTPYPSSGEFWRVLALPFLRPAVSPAYSAISAAATRRRPSIR